MKIIFQIVANVPAYIGGKAVEELIWFFLFKKTTTQQSQTCMDEHDSQSAQSRPIDVIQLLQCIQSGAPIPLKTQGNVSNNNNTSVVC